MFNLKKSSGSFKGWIGECLFKIAYKNIILPRFFNKTKYLSFFGHHFSPPQRAFLEKYWYSLDAIWIGFKHHTKEILLYEIKTRNKYAHELPFKPKMTLQTHLLYNEAKKIGFTPKLVTIWLLDDWNYHVDIADFDDRNYCIDKPKRYDRTTFS